MAHEKWQNSQVRALVAIGVNPLDAQSAVKRFLAKLPYGADPATFVAPAYTLAEDLISKSVADDLRVAWYGSENVEPRFKRLLDAQGK